MEIPEQHRSTVLTLYRVWMFLIIVLIVNLVSAILLLISGGAFVTARRKVRRTLTARVPLFCSKQWRGRSRRSGHVPPCDWCTFYQPSHTLGELTPALHADPVVLYVVPASLQGVPDWIRSLLLCGNKDVKAFGPSADSGLADVFFLFAGFRTPSSRASAVSCR